ncbi:MAG TPA: hypothetical protein VK892_00795, partial [Pyrinomonadaceae bacterium]|nr:hypothetical protein [Pyrinomonadaceae bacterium]
MKRNYDRDNERYGRESEYGSNRDRSRRNQGRGGSERGFKNDILDYNYGREESYFGGGTEGFGKGYLGGSPDYGTGSFGRSYDSDDYSSGSSGRGYSGGSGGSGGYNQGRGGSGS